MQVRADASAAPETEPRQARPPAASAGHAASGRSAGCRTHRPASWAQARGWPARIALDAAASQGMGCASTVLAEVAPICPSASCLQAGEEQDEDVMASEVADLVRRTACHQCLVWAKSDAVVSARPLAQRPAPPPPLLPSCGP